MRITKVRRKGSLSPVLVYIALIGILGVSIYNSATNLKPKDISDEDWDKLVSEYNQYHDIDYHSFKNIDDEYDISTIMATGDLNKAFLDEHEADNSALTISDYNLKETLGETPIEMSISLVNDALNHNANISDKDRDHIRAWAYEVKEINPTFDFRILAANLKNLTIKDVDNKYKEIEDTNLYNPETHCIMITKGNYNRALDHMLFYVATSYTYGDYCFQYDLDQYGYNNTTINYGRGVSEMYAETFSSAINGYYSNNDSAKLLNDIGYAIRCVYGEEAYYNAYSAHDVRAFNELIATHLSEEYAIKLTATIDAIYMDNNKKVTIPADQYPIVAQNIINMLLGAHEDVMKESLKNSSYEHAEEQLTIMNNQLYFALTQITNDTNSSNVLDQYIAEELEIVRNNVLNNIKKKSL